MGQYIPLSVPNISGNERKYADEAVSEGWVAVGAFIPRVEQWLAEYLGAPSSAVCQSGTAGLHLALMVLGVGPGQEVLVPTLSFAATVNPVRYVGAEPVFMDCDDSLCLDMEKLETFCREECELREDKLWNKSTRRHVSAVIPVHVFGNLTDMDRLMPIAEKYRLSVLEDAAEALGSYFKAGAYAGRHAGTVGDMGVYSFNGNKIVTSGGGGAIVSQDTALLEKARHLSTQAKVDEVYFIHDQVGYNYRMTNLTAAVGLGQLEQLESFIGIKEANYQAYLDQGVALHPFREDTRSNRWFYSYLSADRDGLIRLLDQNGVQSRPVWKLLHTLPHYRTCQSYHIEKAACYWEKIVNIPCSTNLGQEDIRRVAGLIHTAER